MATDTDLYAIATTGQLAHFDTSFGQILPRANTWPLLVTQSQDGALILVDPVAGSHLPIPLPTSPEPASISGTGTQSFVLSPDGTHIVYSRYFDVGGTVSGPRQLVLADLRTQTATVLYTSKINSQTGEPYECSIAQPLEWRENTIYAGISFSATWYFCVIDLHNPQPTVPPRIILGDGPDYAWNMAAQRKRILYLTNPATGNLQLEDLETQTQKIVDTSIPNQYPIDNAFALSPDGMQVAYVWPSADGQGGYDVKLYDLTQTRPEVIDHLATAPPHFANNPGAIRWADDGRRFLIIGGASVNVYSSNGQRLGSVPVARIASAAITADNHVLTLSKDGQGAVMDDTPLQAIDKRHYPSVAAPGQRLVYVSGVGCAPI